MSDLREELIFWGNQCVPGSQMRGPFFGPYIQFVCTFFGFLCTISCQTHVRSYVQSHIHFFVYMYTFEMYIYILWINVQCPICLKKCGLRGQATFCRVKKCSLRPRADKCTIVCTNPYVHSYVQIKTKNTFVCTKKPARIYILYGTVCTIKYTIRGYP